MAKMASIPGGGKAKFGSPAFNAAHGVGKKTASQAKSKPSGKGMAKAGKK